MGLRRFLIRLLGGVPKEDLLKKIDDNANLLTAAERAELEAWANNPDPNAVHVFDWGTPPWSEIEKAQMKAAPSYFGAAIGAVDDDCPCVFCTQERKRRTLEEDVDRVVSVTREPPVIENKTRIYYGDQQITEEKIKGLQEEFHGAVAGLNRRRSSDSVNEETEEDILKELAPEGMSLDPLDLAFDRVEAVLKKTEFENPEDITPDAMQRAVTRSQNDEMLTGTLKWEERCSKGLHDMTVWHILASDWYARSPATIIARRHCVKCGLQESRPAELGDTIIDAEDIKDL